MISEFDNIPKVRARDLSNRFRFLKERMAKDAEEVEKIHERLIRMLGPGTYETCTVYKVGEVEVSGYTRKPFTAIRARTRQR